MRKAVTALDSQVSPLPLQGSPREFGMVRPMQRLPSVTRDTALFLDFDGTLAELAPRPELVHVAQGLIPCLAALHEMLDGALAIISGRRLDDLDRFLHPLILP